MESLRSVPSAHMMAHDYPAPGGQMPSSGLEQWVRGVGTDDLEAALVTSLRRLPLASSHFYPLAPSPKPSAVRTELHTAG